MKQCVGLFLAMALFFSAIGQEKYPYRKNHTLGVHYTLHDFSTGLALKNTSLSDVLNKGDWKDMQLMNPGFAISYTRGITDRLDVMSRLGYSYLDYPRPGTTPGINSNERGLFEGDVNLNVKLLSDKYWVSPFMSVGAGASAWNGYWGAYFPAGLGLQVNIFREVFGIVQAQYRLPLTGNTNNHVFYSFGLGANIGKKKEVVVAPLPPPPPPADTDKDGIVDSLDACPTVPGLAQFKGCPDTDKDGIQDSEDKCPTVPGLPKYQGCPIPDTDGDGINDEEDKCPTIAGLARYQGCPIPDTDGDGINDEEDRCPDVPGVPEMMGCPRIDFQASDVTFASGKAVLTAAGKKELDVEADFLNKNPNVKVSIEGHTDNTGNDKINQPLSEKRAEAAKAYLVSKGVAADRMSISGFGSTQPVADNKTAAGRQKNRRVEIKIQ